MELVGNSRDFLDNRSRAGERSRVDTASGVVLSRSTRDGRLVLEGRSALVQLGLSATEGDEAEQKKAHESWNGHCVWAGYTRIRRAKRRCYLLRDRREGASEEGFTSLQTKRTSD